MRGIRMRYAIVQHGEAVWANSELDWYGDHEAISEMYKTWQKKT